MSLQLKIGFVGAGAMAQAIAEGLLTSGTLGPDNITASATSSRFRQWWEERKIKFSEDNNTVVDSHSGCGAGLLAAIICCIG